MNCPKCGSEIIEGYQFCMNCGASIVREPEEEEYQEMPETAPEPPAETDKEPAAAEEPAPRRRRTAQAYAVEEKQAPAAPAQSEEEPPVRLQKPAVTQDFDRTEDFDQTQDFDGMQQPIQAQEPVPEPPQARPPRQKPSRPAAPLKAARQYKRSSGKSVWFWLGILLLVLAAAYVAACILMPDNQFTAPAVNLALTVWNYFIVCGKYLLWFPIALGAIILLAVLKVVLGRPLRRKLHAADMAEARELASRVVVAETLAPPHQLHAEIAEIMETRKLRKKYFPKGKFDFAEFSAGGVPLDYSCGKDQFTANYVFQRMDRAGTRIFLEIIRWQVNNGVVSRRCLSAMRGLEPMLRDTVLDIDNSAVFQVYDR